MQSDRQAPEIPAEIVAFITEGTHRLATISLNDYGFLLSSRMAQTYLDQAMHLLESRRGFDQAFRNEVRLLKAAAQSIASEYAQFEKFCNDCERFKRLETRNWRERLSKWAVCAIARSHRGTVSHHLAHKIRTFHSRICSILTGK
jgi:DNA repair ATPase RecN